MESTGDDLEFVGNKGIGIVSTIAGSAMTIGSE